MDWVLFLHGFDQGTCCSNSYVSFTCCLVIICFSCIQYGNLEGVSAASNSLPLTNFLISHQEHFYFSGHKKQHRSICLNHLKTGIMVDATVVKNCSLAIIRPSCTIDLSVVNELDTGNLLSGFLSILLTYSLAIDQMSSAFQLSYLLSTCGQRMALERY